MLPFRTLVVEVTQRCNNACLHCYNPWREGGGSMSALPRGRLVSLVAGVQQDTTLEQIAISGGEPLLRRDLEAIVRDLDRLGLQVVVITNATLLNARRLASFPTETVFEITLFSTDEGAHDQLAGRHVFARVLENIILLRRAGHHFVLSLVITRLNAHDVSRTIQLGVALGAKGVLLNRLNLSRRLFVHGPDLVPTADQIRAALAAGNEQAVRLGIPIGVAVPIPPCVADPRDYPGLQFGWCPRGGSDSYYTLGADGTLRPCNHSSAVLGDLQKQGFAEIVASSTTQAFWNATPRECDACDHPLRDQCRGGCPAAAIECYEEFTRRDPFVSMANSSETHPIALEPANPVRPGMGSDLRSAVKSATKSTATD